MIERLVVALETLAVPADVQLARVPDFAAQAGELALDFADALRLVTACPQLHLTSAQRESLEQLDAYLERLAGSAGDALRTEKGSVQFPHDEPLPLDLVAEIVRFRAAEQSAKQKSGARRRPRPAS